MSIPLGRKKQCSTCPWRVGASVDNIPGYDLEKHQALSETIAAGPLESLANPELRGMYCHHADDQGNDTTCIGWLHNQLGPGNNIRLRLECSRNPEIGQTETDGPQRENFSETFER